MDADDLAVTPTHQQLAARRGLLDALSAEVDRQLLSVGERSRSMATRAAILVSAASILAGITAPIAGALAPWPIATVATAAGAGVLGVVVLIPRRATELDVEYAEHELWGSNVATAVWTLNHWKLDTLREQEKALMRRATAIAAGFGFLAASIVCGVLTIVLTH